MINIEVTVMVILEKRERMVTGTEHMFELKVLFLDLSEVTRV